jgi:hypothetical protein
MNEIIQFLSQKLNLPEGIVRSAAGVLLNFIKQKATGSQFESFVGLLPGANELMASSAGTEAAGGGGLLSGLIGAASDLIGGHAAEAGKAISALEQAGVPADKALPLATGFFEKVKEIVGPDAINQLAANVPALQTFLGGEK